MQTNLQQNRQHITVQFHEFVKEFTVLCQQRPFIEPKELKPARITARPVNPMRDAFRKIGL